MLNDEAKNAGSAAHQRGKIDKAGLVPGAPGDAPNRAKQAYREYKAALVHSAPGDAPDDAPVWKFRGYLPHRDEIGIIQSLTFRLADSLPQEKLRELEEEIKNLPNEKQAIQRRIQIEKWLDAGMGCCALRHPALAEVVEVGFLLNDGIRYHLLAWCIMPNHAHVLIYPLVALPKIVGSWKSYSGRWAMAQNSDLKLGINGKTLWQREVWDRYMRDEYHLSCAIEYIHDNPVKAGLCAKPEDWRWSSAWKKRELGAPHISAARLIKPG
ncbi:MAG: transposase [Betaproteobacteria bacterium]|nr:transposase [Betaproteobacteria bacterium]